MRTTVRSIPVSTYGASKLAGEALISSYAAMFDLVGRVFRFGNVVGPRQTHGVGFDFVRKLLADPIVGSTILGDGTQSKSYIHVTDVVRRGPDRVRAHASRRSRRSTLRRVTTSPSARSQTSRSNAPVWMQTRSISPTRGAQRLEG